MSGNIIFEGPSRIDGSPIVVVVTEESRNAKTGAGLLQTWIIRADMAPFEAARTGSDVAICGSCALRPTIAAMRKAAGELAAPKCYVTLIHGPRAVYEKYRRGGYELATTRAQRRRIGAGRLVRLGSYGDPAAAPAGIWRDLLADSIGRTGYTHQWQHPDPRVRRNAAALRRLVMASADTPEQAEQAARLGWRTFRVRQPSQPLLSRERTCPASAEAGKRLSCDACCACDGATRGNRIAIIDHGPGHLSRARAAA